MAPRGGGSSSPIVLATLAAIIAGVLVLEVLSAAAGPPPLLGPATTTSQVNTSMCTTVQPGTVFITVASDTNQSPVAAALVTATNVPGYCGDNPAVAQTTITFLTDGNTIWYSLSGQDNEGYTFSVRYQGQTYGFSIVLEPLSTTCAILYVPSGTANVTQTIEPSCPLLAATTSSPSSQESASLASEP